MNAPEHTIETRHVPVDGFHFPQPRTFVDGVLATSDRLERIGWGRVSALEAETKRWDERMSFPPGPEAWDKCQTAHELTAKLRGEGRYGEPSNMTAKFEHWLLSNGWEPIVLDSLNAYQPGVVLIEPKEGHAGGLLYLHVYTKEGRRILFQFGVGPFLFVFQVSDKMGTYFQVPVDDSLFPEAAAGLLTPLSFQP